MKIRIYSLIGLLTLVGMSLFAQEDQRPPREKWFLESVEGTVKEIDAATRAITLVGNEGEMVTFTASNEVKRFDEIAVGDVISFEYWTYIKAEFRRPTLEELAEPVQMIAEAGKAPDDMAPGAVVGAVVKAVVSIEIINRPYMLVTVRGPQGNYTTLPVEDPMLIEQLNVGEIVILTYAEAVAVALEKKTPATPEVPSKKKKK